MADQLRNLKGAERYFRKRSEISESKRDQAYWLNRALEYKEKINQLENLEHGII